VCQTPSQTLHMTAVSTEKHHRASDTRWTLLHVDYCSNTPFNDSHVKKMTSDEMTLTDGLF